jgi:hypothetical protein
MGSSSETVSVSAICGRSETGTRPAADLVAGDHLLGKLENLRELHLGHALIFAQGGDARTELA